MNIFCVNAFDPTLLRNVIANTIVHELGLYSESVVKCGDINGDGINIIGAALIRRYPADFQVNYPMGESIA